MSKQKREIQNKISRGWIAANMARNHAEESEYRIERLEQENEELHATLKDIWELTDPMVDGDNDSQIRVFIKAIYRTPDGEEIE